MPKQFTILYVDDERGNLNAFRNSFRRDYNILIAETGEEALRIFENETVDLVLSDQRMPGMSGVEFLQKVIELNPEPSRILVTAYSDIDAIQGAVNKANIFKYIKKPWDTGRLKQTIDQALDLYDLRQQNLALNVELAEKNEALKAANQSLGESDQLKYDFLKIISHEMRTPLNGLKGATQLFKIKADQSGSHEDKSLISVLETSTDRLEQFLLLAERITTLKAKQYALELRQTNIASLVQAAGDQLADDLKQRQQNIGYHFDSASTIEADPEILSICIRELIHNASSNSPLNSTISVRTLNQAESLTLEVSDQGKGFPEDVLRNLFQPFIRDDRGSDRGLGLNLALTKLVMDLHGGKVEASNNQHGGATVKLSLKRTQTAA